MTRFAAWWHRTGTHPSGAAHWHFWPRPMRHRHPRVSR